MLPASNRGTGQNAGFPDPCSTPSNTGSITIPYPNIASHGSASGSATTVMISGMNALNTDSSIATTSGDEAGVLDSTKGEGAFSVGNPFVYIEKLPAVTLGCATTGNDENNSLGAVVVPAVTTIFFSQRATPAGAPDVARLDHARDRLAARRTDDGVGYLRLDSFAPASPSLLAHAIHRLGELRCLTLDLRDNPGGDMRSALRCAELFLPKGTFLWRAIDADGDAIDHRVLSSSTLDLPLVILVDGGTASAAELFAGALQAAGRATLVGEGTYGKGHGNTLPATPEGARRFELAEGRVLEGVGLEPDVRVDPDVVGAPDPERA